MRKPGGCLITVDPAAAAEVHVDTFTCKHCQKIQRVQAKERAEDIGGLCKQCMGLICPECVAKGTCTPWEKQMEAMERRERLYAALR